MGQEQLEALEILNIEKSKITKLQIIVISVEWLMCFPIIVYISHESTILFSIAVCFCLLMGLIQSLLIVKSFSRRINRAIKEIKRAKSIQVEDITYKGSQDNLNLMETSINGYTEEISFEGELVPLLTRLIYNNKYKLIIIEMLYNKADLVTYIKGYVIKQ